MLEDLLVLLELAVSVPAARRDAALVEVPVRQLVLDRRAAEVVREVQLVRAQVVEHVGEQRRVAVEEPLARRLVEVRVRLAQFRESRLGDALDGRPARREDGAADVDADDLRRRRALQRQLVDGLVRRHHRRFHLPGVDDVRPVQTKRCPFGRRVATTVGARPEQLVPDVCHFYLPTVQLQLPALQTTVATQRQHQSYIWQSERAASASSDRRERRERQSAARERRSEHGERRNSRCYSRALSSRSLARSLALAPHHQHRRVGSHGPTTSVPGERERGTSAWIPSERRRALFSTSLVIVRGTD